MMKVLKEISLERNESIKNEELIKTKIKDVTDKEFENKKLINKLNSDIKYCSNANDELLRFVQDQKSKINIYKQKYENEKKKIENLKLINEELENLRKKNVTKINILNKEIEILTNRMKECKRKVEELKNNEKVKEETERSFTDRLFEMERLVDEQKKEIEEKKRTLEVCNSEMAYLIAKEKRMKDHIKNFKEKSDYYERLY